MNMRNELTPDDLIDKYPDYMIDKKGNRCKIECKSGWYNLIEDFLINIDNIDLVKEVKCNVKVKEIKEKFGIMRISFVSTGDGMVDLKLASVSHAYENKSSLICSLCGSPAKPGRDRNKPLTLCDKHYREVIQ